ncbi:MAG: hypothetical protein ACK4Z4_02700 [Ferrovibrio sp.]
MTTRSTETKITFMHPFKLTAFDAPKPAGTYLLVVDEERIEGLSFTAFHRTATTLYTPDVSVRSGAQQAYPTTEAEIDAALETDALRQIMS